MIFESKNGINEIKLRQLLSIRQDLNSNPIIRTIFPPVELGSITLVDQIILLTLTQLLKPKTIIEVGTYLGYTTALLAMNTHANIFTIDLPASEEINNINYNEELIELDGAEMTTFFESSKL